MALIGRLKMVYPQLKYSNTHPYPFPKTTKKSQSWKAGQGRQADETNTLPIKQGYLDCDTYILETGNDFQGQPGDHLS